MGVEINPFKAPSLTSYTTPSSRVSSGPPDVAMCQSPAPFLFSFLLFFPFLSPNHMPWYSLITASMLLLFFFFLGGCLCTDCPMTSFLPKCLYMASEMYVNFISCYYPWFSHLNLCPAPFLLHFPTLLSSDHHLVKKHAYGLSTMCQWLAQKTETPVDELMSNLLIYLAFWLCPF